MRLTIRPESETSTQGSLHISEHKLPEIIVIVERFALSRFSAAVSEVRAGEWHGLFDDE
jgi:hypothetical protein